MDKVSGKKGVPIKLSSATLGELPSNVSTPNYERQSLSAGMVHIGLGNFHRAHQAWYLHRLLQTGKAHDWAIVGAGVRSYDAAMRDRLKSQDCLTTLLELDPAGSSVEVIGPMIDYLPIEEDNRALVAQMVDPAIRIVSLTVTEGGYYLTAEGTFDVEHEDILHDAANPDTPRTAFGAMVAALKARRAAGHAPFTALSCDNLQGNGAILRQTLVGLAELTDADLAKWISEEGAFPNSMVDCIVPATDDAVIAQVKEAGIDDAAPVSHENFRQWVIEDDFCQGRPNWEEVGATLTKNVHHYEAMKLRVLNGGHQLLANAGEILSVETISGCMKDADISAFFTKVEADDILPQVAPVPENTPKQYLDLVVGRFSNPKIHDTTRRVAFDGSSRHAGFLLPTLRDAIASNGSITGLALAEALWARMCAGTREDGSAIEANDPFWDDLTAAAQAAKTNPQAWLDQDGIYGTLGQEKRLSDEFSYWLNLIWSKGTRAALKEYVSRA